MKTSGKNDRRPPRSGVLANFQFYVDEDAKGVCEGLTLNVSDHGFGFLTQAEIRRGQTITVTRHALHGFSCPKAKVRWVKKSSHCLEVGAEFCSGN